MSSETQQSPFASKIPLARVQALDSSTIRYWYDIWLRNIKENKRRFGSFSSLSIGKFHKINDKKPALIIGSGPSLKKNISQLWRAKKQGILSVSCLHNFPHLHDNNAHADFYVTTDAGMIVSNHISEGGKLSREEYLKATKGKILLASTFTHPVVFEDWGGEVYFYNLPQDRGPVDEEFQKIETFSTNVPSGGGTVLGVAFYIAKLIMGSNPIAFVGADFAYGPDKKDYCWDHPDSKENQKRFYDSPLEHVDIYGNKAFTSQGYYLMKHWFDDVCITTPGLYINCTEGGILGAYDVGNIASILQMPLKDFFKMYRLSDLTESQCKNPEKPDIRVLFNSVRIDD